MERAAPEAALRPEIELEELLDSFIRVQEVDDPVRRQIAVFREAERYGLSVDDYGRLFTLYARRRRAPKWLLETYTEKLVDRLQSLSFFSLLEYVGRLAIVMAIFSFFLDLPERHKQQEYETWHTAEAASGKVYSRARISALEQLNGSCVSLEGLNARRAYLRGLRLDRCYGVPGGYLLGRWAPAVFRRQGAVLLGADLEEARLEGSRLPEADLRDAALAGSHLASADLEEAQLQGADLGGADLFRVNLRGARLAGANLQNADLSNADLEGADLTRARLQGARLVGANLRGAVLRYAQLQGANLSRTDLRGTELFYADLSGASLRKARLDGRTGLEKSEVRRADFRGATLPLKDHLRSARDWTLAITDPAEPAKTPGPAFTLGLIVDDEQHFFEEVERGARRAAGKEAELIVRVATAGPGTKAENEAAIVQELIRRGADGIVLVPQDERRSVPVLRRAFDAGLVIVTYDHSLNRGDASRLLAANYESDQFELGRETGQAVVRWLKRQPDVPGPREVGIFKYCDFEGCYRRVEGFRAALDKSGVRWREAGYRNRRGRESSAEAAAGLLADHPGLAVLWSANESGTESLVAAIRARRLDGRVRVWGTDISPQLAGMLLAGDGVLQGVTGQRPEEMGYQAVSMALESLKGRRRRAFESGTVEVQPFNRDDPQRVREYLETRSGATAPVR
ncbi:MAG TPA: pentapeptide repeat-containing protein [Thermoanaerobaculia bacterium]|nr:pentapeptide repeat-containing protein [Thermoanaerobaculia bacterium]